jgi:hypothetical protein
MIIASIGFLLILTQSLAITVLNETSIKVAKSPMIFIPKSIEHAIPYHSNELKFLRTINLAPLIEETNGLSNKTYSSQSLLTTLNYKPRTLPILSSESYKKTSFDEGFFSTRPRETSKTTLTETSTKPSSR